MSEPRHRPLAPGRRARWLVLLAAGLAVWPALWQVAQLARASATEEIRAGSRHTLEIYAANLRTALEKYASLPAILATNKDLIRLLLEPDNATRVDSVNRYLERINGVADASDIYLMDTDGLTLAASNWGDPHSFVGSNFSFRPYFRQAVEGSRGRYFALGTTSLKRGYYFSAPVMLGGEILGVTVVKVSVDDVEAAWIQGNETVLATDDAGVIFVSSRPEWVFRTLEPLPAERLTEIARSRKYFDVELRPLEVVSREPLDGGGTLIGIRSDGRDTSREQAYLMQSHRLSKLGWTVYHLADVAPVDRHASAVVTLTAFGLLILALLVGYLLQRRVNQAQRLALERQAADALQRAHDELELRVRERTADLSATNERLEQEIADRRRAEQVLREAQDELIQAGKLAALGQMAAGITHELNQPLAAIRTYSDNALTFLERGRDREARGNLKLIAELTARMAQITRHLKTFARKSSGEVLPVPLETVIGDALVLLDAAIQRSEVRVIRDGECAGVRVLGDLVRLEQVLVNLLRNGLDAMQHAARRELHIGCRLRDERVVVTVRDTGPGIASADLARIFDPFFTTKEVGEGLGLGLSISYGIVQDCGGTISASNHPDGGAEFKLSLRRAAGHAEKVA